MIHKIKINYRLSSKGMRIYFLAGNKQEENQELWIETDNQNIIDQAELIDNEYLSITLYSLSKYEIRFRKFGYGFHYDEPGVLKDEELMKMDGVKIVRNDKSFYSDELLTQKTAINILSKNKVSNDIQERFEKYHKICAKNDCHF